MAKTRITIISGFLGSGKTTLIRKLLTERTGSEKTVLIENEFGQIGIDGGFLQDTNIAVKEINSGCICCSLVGDFVAALQTVLNKYALDRVLIEPSGVGKLSEIIRAVRSIRQHEISLDGMAVIVDASKYHVYMKNFAEFYTDQIQYANCMILSHTKRLTEQQISGCISELKQINNAAQIITTDWAELTAEQIMNAMRQKYTLNDELRRLLSESTEHKHDHDHHAHCCECCHDHGQTHHHKRVHEHHHADKVFTSWGIETTHAFDKEKLSAALKSLQSFEEHGIVLRAKGIVPATDGTWLHFDYTPGESDIRTGSAGVIGRLCVIGNRIHASKLETLFLAS